VTDSRKAYLRGVRHALPFILVVAPFGMLFGVVASDAGLAEVEIAAFSLAVFAGAAQFAALQLMQDQAPLWIILATSLAVNLRLVMYSVAIAPHYGAAPIGLRAVMAYFLVDQSFALSMAEFDRRPTMTVAEKIGYFLGGVTPVTAVWFVSILVGARMGRAIPPEYALDFAVPITFLALTAPMLRTVAHQAAAAVSVVAALALSALPYGTGLLVAAVLAMATGVGVEAIHGRRARA